MFVVMPLLSKDLKRLVQERGRMSPQQLWWLAVRLLEAAEHCHRHRVVHRDIKVGASGLIGRTRRTKF